MNHQSISTEFVEAQLWDASWQEYLTSERMGSSALWRCLVDGPDDSDPMTFGRAVHSGILEPHLFNEQVICMPPFGRKKGDLEQKNIFLKEHQGKNILKPEEYDCLQGCIQALQQHPIVSRILDHPSVIKESSMTYRHATTGIELKSRRDLVISSHLSDIKTSRSPELDKFERSIYEYGYHLQGALYTDAHYALTGEPASFTMIVVGTKPPHRVAIYELGEGWLSLGRKAYRTALRLEHWHRQTGNCRLYWEHNPRLLDGPPPWVMARMEHIETLSKEIAP